MRRTYLITGGAGFIGSHLVDKLLNDSNIVCVDNFDAFYSRSIKEKNIENHINKPNYKLYEADISDFDSMKTYLKLMILLI